MKRILVVLLVGFMAWSVVSCEDEFAPEDLDEVSEVEQAATRASGIPNATCNSWYGNCDNNACNGCETYLRSNESHCGACGRRCAYNYECQNGVCKGPITECEMEGRPCASDEVCRNGANCSQCRCVDDYPIELSDSRRPRGFCACPPW